jgi:dTDP-4-dehydrorhamnose 3,5-epimerase
MDIEHLGPPGLALLTPRRFGDARGWFSETWNAQRMAEAGFDIAFVQDNHAFSADAMTVRGLHYQAPPFAQTKLVRCIHGRILDVAVDVRRGSPTFGQWRAVELDAESGTQLLVPQGFLHGYLTLTPDAEVLYKVDALYAPQADGAVRFDDPDLAIDWRHGMDGITVSAKDAAAPAFRDFVSPFTYEDGP